MTKSAFTASGVRVADDFRDNLIIDRYDAAFEGMRASKLKHLRSANSEDAVTWNVFRSLRQLSPHTWLPTLFSAAFPGRPTLNPDHATVELWVSVSPPPALLLQGDEGDSEVDVMIEAPDWVWIIEAKYRSDISVGTTTRPTRDQLLRNIDIGSYHAGVRPFYFSLLMASEQASAQGAATILKYSDLAQPRSLLASHRPDGLANLRGVSALRWRQVGAVLRTAAQAADRDEERAFASRALAWLTEKGLADNAA